MELDRNIRVSYFTHPVAFNIFGGAEIQILKTKMYLEKLGNSSIKLFDAFHDNIEDYDILHNFQMSSESLPLFRLAKLKGKKTVLSPIYWESSPPILHKIGPTAFFRLYSNWKTYRIPAFYELYPFKDFLELADIVLPNSRIEAALLSVRFRVNPKKFFVVPNGVDKRFLEAKPDLFVEKYGVKDFILYVGKIEERKNVLALLKVCKEIELPTIIIGDGHPFKIDYFMKCRKIIESSRSIQFISSLSHDSEELRSAYGAAKVFVLPSLYETPGLSALEAGLAGCNLVITRGGSTTEYFKNHALYIDPASKEDIKKKILEAYERPKNNVLKEHILNNYTWEKTAKRTLDAYNLTRAQ